jgi:hypothetical protein
VVKDDNKALKYVRKNIILDAILFIFMAGLAVSGDSDLHPILGIIVVILVLIHIAWHQKQIKVMFRQAFPNLTMQKPMKTILWGLGIIAIILSLFMVFE